MFLRKDNQVLLLKRLNTGYMDNMFGLPSGHIEGGELSTSAMIREAKEEVGIDIKSEDIRFVHVTHRLNKNVQDERIDFFFETWDWQGEIKNIEPDKCSELTWFEIDKLPENIIPHVKIVFEKVLNNVFFSEYVKEP